MTPLSMSSVYMQTTSKSAMLANVKRRIRLYPDVPDQSHAYHAHPSLWIQSVPAWLSQCEVQVTFCQTCYGDVPSGSSQSSSETSLLSKNVSHHLLGLIAIAARSPSKTRPTVCRFKISAYKASILDNGCVRLGCSSPDPLGFRTLRR